MENRVSLTKLYDIFMFDLDGTVINSGPGIMASVAFAMEKMGRDIPPESTLRRFVGPSLMYGFTNFLGLTEAQAQEATSYYRTYYPEKGIFDAVLYDGITDVFAELLHCGKTLHLVTSKPHVYAERILKHFHLESFFSYIAGPEFTDTSSEKVRLIEKAVADCELDRKKCVMIGDTHFDMEGAQKASVAAVGVTYGYGSLEELLQTGADFIAASPKEIPSPLSAEKIHRKFKKESVQS